MDDTGLLPDDPSIPPETVLWRLVKSDHVLLDPNIHQWVPLPPAYDDNTDGPYREPMSAYISTECGDPGILRHILPGTWYVVKFTVGFARSLGLHVARDESKYASGHVVLDGGMRVKLDYGGKKRRRQWIFAHSFNPDEDWVIGPAD